MRRRRRRSSRFRRKLTAGDVRNPVRNPEVIIIAGRNGSGKTTLARKLVSKLDVQVISPSGEWGSWNAQPERLVTAAIARQASGVVLDDCDAYLTGSTSAYWRRLLSTNRHLGLDIILITRRPQELPHWAIAACTRAYVMVLGPRESAWARRVLGVDPPTKMFEVKGVAL